jgi:hypothetical protein
MSSNEVIHYIPTFIFTQKSYYMGVVLIKTCDDYFGKLFFTTTNLNNYSKYLLNKFSANSVEYKAIINCRFIFNNESNINIKKYLNSQISNISLSINCYNLTDLFDPKETFKIISHLINYDKMNAIIYVGSHIVENDVEYVIPTDIEYESEEDETDPTYYP